MGFADKWYGMATKQKSRKKGRKVSPKQAEEVRFPPLAQPDPEQYRRDLEALEPYLDAAETDYERVAELPLWKPTAYERYYLPARRMAGLRGKSRIVLQNSADLHLHTEYSDGDDLDRVLEHAVNVGLDAIAITDHDEIEGAFEARRRVHERRLPLAIIPGVEVSSSEGHIGALFVTQEVPKDKSAAETIDLIHAAGGLAVAHHPFVPRWIEMALGIRLGCRELIESLPFDAVECTNAVPGRGTRYNLAAIERLREQQLRVAVTGSSDAHIADLIGKGRTYYSGNEGVVSLRTGIIHGFTHGAEGYWSSREKLRYYSHLVRAIIKNTLLRRGSVN